MGTFSVEFTVGFLDRQVVNAGEAALHVAEFIEFPEFVAIGTEPMAGVVVPFVFETHGHAVAAKAPEFFLEAVIQFAIPFAPEKFDDLRAALDEFGAVAPLGVFGIGEGDAFGVAGVPGVFGGLDFLHGGFFGERRQGRTRIHSSIIIVFFGRTGQFLLALGGGGIMGAGFRLNVEGLRSHILWLCHRSGQNLAFFGINLGSLWLFLGSFWVRFFTIINNDGQSLASFFQKNFFWRIQEPPGSDE